MIISIFMIRKSKYKINKLLAVIEYTGTGTLNYLNNNFNNLTWGDKTVINVT